MKLLNVAKILVVLGMICGLNQNAYAQAEKIGNGGKGVLCGNNLRVLDIYESEEIYKYQSQLKYSTLDENLSYYGLLVGQYLSERPIPENTEILPWLKKEIIDRIQDIPAGTSLELTEDATIPKLPSECKVVQIATYLDSEKIIKRDRLLWEMLDVKNQVALILHEEIYKMARDIRSTNSDNSRIFIAKLLSGKISGSKFQEVIESKDAIWCGAGIGENTFEFYLTEQTINNQKGLLISFLTVDGNFELTKATSFIPVTFNSFIEGDFLPASTSVVRDNSVIPVTLKFTPGPKVQSYSTIKLQAIIGSKTGINLNGFCETISK